MLRVRDHGGGIAPHERQSIFRPFHKSADAAAHSAPGVGLGLALCARLSRALGGRLSLEKMSGSGAPFAVADPTLEDIYAKNYWEIQGKEDKITWVEIHHADEARKSGVAHVEILARKKGAPIWEIEHVCGHLAITTDALRHSVLRPYKTRSVYPATFEESYDHWKLEDRKGTAFICSTSIQDFLNGQK